MLKKEQNLNIIFANGTEVFLWKVNHKYYVVGLHVYSCIYDMSNKYSNENSCLDFGTVYKNLKKSGPLTIDVEAVNFQH
jgi:hypothetical protein